MSTIPANSAGMPIAASPAAYFRQIDEINDAIMDLREVAHILTDRQKKQLRDLAGRSQETTDVTVDTITDQYAMFEKLKSRLVDANGELLDDFDSRSLQGLIASFNSLASLFLKNKALIDHLKEVSHLQEAINSVVRDFSPEDQRKFYMKLESLKS